MKWETSIDKWETNAKSCGPRVKWETSGDKWETNVKSCGQSIQSEVGDKRRQVGDKCEIMRPENAECIGRQLRNIMLESKPGDKCKIMRPEQAPLSKSKNPSQVNLFGEKSKPGSPSGRPPKKTTFSVHWPSCNSFCTWPCFSK